MTSSGALVMPFAPSHQPSIPKEKTGRSQPRGAHDTRFRREAVCVSAAVWLHGQSHQPGGEHLLSWCISRPRTHTGVGPRLRKAVSTAWRIRLAAQDTALSRRRVTGSNPVCATTALPRVALSALSDVSPLEQDKRQAKQHDGQCGQHSGVTPVHAVDERVAAQVIVER